MTVAIAPKVSAAIANRTAAEIAHRNELVVEAIPLAKLIVSTYCRDHGLFGLRDEIEAEALAGLLNLADTYRPASPWLKYVNRNDRVHARASRRGDRPAGSRRRHEIVRTRAPVGIARRPRRDPRR
jgi:hypothetical protein